MELPVWVTRETLQVFVIMAITIGFHYFYISTRIANKITEDFATDDTIDDDLQ